MVDEVLLKIWWIGICWWYVQSSVYTYAEESDYYFFHEYRIEILKLFVWLDLWCEIGYCRQSYFYDHIEATQKCQSYRYVDEICFHLACISRSAIDTVCDHQETIVYDQYDSDTQSEIHYPLNIRSDLQPNRIERIGYFIFWCGLSLDIGDIIEGIVLDSIFVDCSCIIIKYVVSVRSYIAPSLPIGITYIAQNYHTKYRS